MKKVRRKLNRIGALALAVVLMGTSIDFPVIAAGNCEHHTEHTAECGYKDAVEGADCTHEHGDECYSKVTDCVHSHDGECGYVEAVEGADCNHSHDENCGENGEECNHEHDDSCGYKEAQEGSECNHECSEESGCIKTEENCNHSHDESCGYKEAVEGTPCSFSCDDCASEESGQEDEEENDTCICEDKCTADAVNEECPVCSLEEADLALCEGEAVEEEEETDTCICENKCTADTVNEECPVCSLEEADLTLCVGEETVICTCETDDPAFHATNCPAYIAPENPQCYCAEKCTEDTLNVWCDVCGMQGVNACQGTDTAVTYDAATPDFSAAKVLTVVDGTLCIDGVAITDRKMPAGDYKLESDITTNIHVFTEGSINIDLNGHTWNMSDKNLRIDDNVTLSLYDTSGEGTGKITSSYMQTVYGVGSGTTFNLYSGTVENTSNEGNDRVVFSYYGIINLYGGTIKSNAYAVLYYLHRDITINIDNTSFDCGDGYAQFFASFSSYEEPCAVIDVSDYEGGTLTVDAIINKAGKMKIFTGIQSAQDADNYKINFSCDDDKDFFEEKQEYEEDGGNKYVYVSVPSFTTQPTEENDYTVVFNRPDATLQWCEKTVCDSATYTEEDGDPRESYVVNAGDRLIVSVSECSDDFYVDFDCSYDEESEESLYMSLDSSSETASVTFDSEGTVNVVIRCSPFGTGEYKIEHVRYTELEGENGVQLSKTECETTYVCKATLGETVYYSDEVTIEQEHSYTCTATSANVITKECANCGKSGTLTITAKGGVYDGTTAYGATVEKTGILENEEVIVYYYQDDTLIGTDAPVDAGTYTAKITYEGKTASVTYMISTTPTAEMFAYIESAVYDGTEKSANVVVKDGITGIGAITNIKYYQNGTEVTPINAGTYTVKIDVAEGDDYDAATDIEVGTFEITKATPTSDMFTATPSSELVYDGTEKSIIVTTDKVGMGAFTVSYVSFTDSTQPVDAGTYIIRLHIEEGDNYIAVDTLSFSAFVINKANSVISAAPTPIADLVYDGTAHNLINAGTATGGEMQYSLDGTNYSSAIPTGTDAKTYTVWYKVVGDKNHNDTEPESIKVTIAPKTVEISSVTAIDRPFDGTNAVEISEVIIEGILDEDNDNVSVSATAAIDSINAGEYIIVDLSNIALTGSANYSIAASVENVPLTTAVTISKADAPTLPSGSKAYVYSIGYEGESVSITGLPTDCGEVEYSLLSVSSDMFENLSVDSRSGKITYDVKELDNYTEDLQGIISVNVMMENYKTAIYTLTITRTEKIPQNISAEDITLTYGDADATISVTGAKTELSYEVVEDSNDNGYVVTVDANGKVSIENAGTAIIKITAVASDTYAESECEISVTVNKRPVNVPAKDSTVYTYTGKEQTYSIASSPYYTIGNATHTDAGKYIVSVTLNDNYEWNGNLPVYEFEIKPAAVTITANSYSVKEGDELPDFGYTVNGLVNGETLPITVSVTCEASDTSVAGTYDITVTGTTSEGNYTYTYKTGVLAITHDIELRNVKEATCTAGGYSGDKYCTVCGETIESGTATEPLGHNYVSKVTKQPTTTEEGVMTYTCSRCGDSYTKPISKLPSSGGDSDDDSGNGETGGSSGGGSTNDTPATETPTPQTLAGGTTAPTTPQPGGKTPVAEPDEETDNPEPFIKGDDGKEGWDVIRDEVEDAEEGDTVTVDMNGTTVVPGDVFDDIKGKDVTVVFDLGNGVAWNVNGKDITSDNVGDIDFEVKVGADANDSIPVEVRNAVTGESYFVNISLAYDGEFGFEAVLSVNLEKENAGLYANLFYYNPQTNEMEFICSDVIAEDGTAEFIFTHASEYTIVIDKVAMDAPASSEEGVLPEIGLEAEEDNSSDATNVSDPLEFGSDDNNSAWWIILLVALLAVAGVAGFVVYSKKKKSE